MKFSHADFRPGKRSRFVPSGSPRRKIPLLRIGLLLALGLFVYARFDDFWPRVRDAANPAALWRAAFGKPDAPAPALALIWSRDSSRVALDCPNGLTPACREALLPADPDLYGSASALLAKARRKRAVADLAAGAPLRLEARAVVSDLGDWGLELSGLRGRDAAGGFLFRREGGSAGSAAWCDAARGCLREPVPGLPLVGGRLQENSGAGGAVWIAASPRVRAVLPGRVTAVESSPATSSGARGSASENARGSARVRVYHGRELYTLYSGLRIAPGVKPGALVKTGSHLGDVPGGNSGYRLAMRVRQGGQNVDPAAFWGPGAAVDPEAADSDAADMGAP